MKEIFCFFNFKLILQTQTMKNQLIGFENWASLINKNHG
jgi:hypothetical protein